MAYQVCHIDVDCSVRHYIRRIVVEEAVNIRMVAAAAGLVDIRSFAVEEGVRSCVEVAEEVVLHILRGIQILGILTFLKYQV